MFDKNELSYQWLTLPFDKLSQLSNHKPSELESHACMPAQILNLQSLKLQNCQKIAKACLEPQICHLSYF